MAAPPEHVPSASSATDKSTVHGFSVRLVRTGRELWVEPGFSILQTLEAAGICLPYSCREGMCGTCEQRLVGGEADHRDFVLSDEQRAEGRTILICVSRARGDRLELDI